MKKQFTVFLLRWLLNSFGLWVAVQLFGTGYSDSQINESAWVFLLAGLIFSVVNAILKPIIVILSLPAILLTLGLFTFIVNGFMVYISLALAPGVRMTFLYSIITGIVLSLVNYIVSSVIELRRESLQGER
jgi:putative membrane protein